MPLFKKKTPAKKEASPKRPPAAYVAAEELIPLLETHVIPWREDDRLLLFEALRRADAAPGLRLSDAAPCLYSDGKCTPLSCDELVEWIIQSDSKHLLTAERGESPVFRDDRAAIPIYISDLLEQLQERGRVPRRTFLIFREYARFGIGFSDGRFFDGSTRAELSAQEARERERDTRLTWIENNMDRAGCAPEAIEEYLASCKNDMELYIDEILEIGSAP